MKAKSFKVELERMYGKKLTMVDDNLPWAQDINKCLLNLSSGLSVVGCWYFFILAQAQAIRNGDKLSSFFFFEEGP